MRSNRIAIIVIFVVLMFLSGPLWVYATNMELLDDVPWTLGLPGIVLGFAWGLAAWKLDLGNGPRRYRLGIVIAAGCVVFSLGSWAAAIVVNASFDDSAGQSHHTEVLARPQRKSPRRGRDEQYFLELSPFLPEHRGDPVIVGVDKQTYRSTAVGGSVEVVVRPGRLGYRWLEIRTPASER